MIKSFKHKGLEDFFYTGNKKGIKPVMQPDFQEYWIGLIPQTK